MTRSGKWNLFLTFLLLIGAAGCSSQSDSAAVAQEFRQTWKAYQQSEDPAQKLQLASDFLNQHPDSPFTVQLVSAVTRDYYSDAVTDPKGAVAFAQEHLAGLSDPNQVDAGRRVLLRLYGKAGMGKSIAALADKLGSEASLSDRTEIVDAAVAAEDWGLVEREAKAALDLLSPEYLKKRSGGEELTEAQIDFEVRMHKADLYRFLGEARFHQNAVSDALKDFESANQNEIRNFVGIGFTPLDELWGEALLASGENQKAMDVLERPALIGRNEEALGLFRKAYLATGHPEKGFDQFCADRRLEVAPRMPSFEARDYSGKEVTYKPGQGKVTFLAFWFPT
jgi:hypothetical protein